MADHYVEGVRIEAGDVTVVCSCGATFGPYSETDEGEVKGRADYAEHYAEADTSNDIVKED